MQNKLTIPIRFFVTCLALIAACGSSYSSELKSSNLVRKVEIFYDAEGRTDLGSVQEEVFRPGDTSQIPGYRPGAFWARLTVDPSPGGAPLELRIEPHNRNTVTLFSPDEDSPSGWSSQTTGNSIAWKDRPLSAIYLGFEIFPKKTTTYYLRVESLGAMHFQVTVRDKYEAMQAVAKSSMWRGLYLLILLAVVAWSVREVFATRKAELAAFAVSHAGYFVLAMTTFGFVDVIFNFDSGVDSFLFWQILLNTTAALVFHSLLAISFEVSRFFKSFFIFAVTVNLAAIVLMFYGWTTLALRINSIVVLVYAVGILICIIGSPKNTGVPGYRARIAYYGALMLSVTLHLMPTLGLYEPPRFLTDIYLLLGLDGSPFVVGHLFYGFISALLFGHLLLSRSKIERERGRDAEVSLQRSEERLIAQDRRLAEQQKLTALLTHEVRNPLATIRFSLDSLEGEVNQANQKRLLRITNAANSIDSLIERFVLVDALEQGSTNLRDVRLDPQEQAIGLFKKFPQLEDTQLKVESGIGQLHSDPDLLGVVLVNLLDNAVKYTSDLTSVRMSVYRTEPHVVCWQIKNTVPELFQYRPDDMFQKYYRGGGVSNQPGSGLGLYVVKWIVERLGGQISVDFDEQARRLEFNLCVPMSRQSP